MGAPAFMLRCPSIAGGAWEHLVSWRREDFSETYAAGPEGLESHVTSQIERASVASSATSAALTTRPPAVLRHVKQFYMW